jgi:hypothetical protein
MDGWSEILVIKWEKGKVRVIQGCWRWKVRACRETSVEEGEVKINRDVRWKSPDGGLEGCANELAAGLEEREVILRYI